jgi:hypothetical protein
MINKRAFDRFTLAHLAGGWLAAELGASPGQALVIGVGWEILETPLKSAAPAVFPHASPDTAANALVDVAAFFVGYLLGR